MLLSYHLPITDLRYLLQGSKNSRLPRPEWATPEQDSRFMRGFGEIEKRNLDGDVYFGGGSKVCDASGVIKFKSIDPTDLQLALPDNKFLKVDCHFRRFFSFGDASAKFEFGFTQKAIKLSQEYQAIPMSIESILESLFDFPVMVRFPQAPHSKKATKKLNQRNPRRFKYNILGHCGKYLSETLLYASTSSLKGVKIEDWWIKCGEPILFFEFNKEEPFIVPHHAELLDCSDKDIDMYKYILTRKNNTVSYIIKRKNHNKARDKSRSLRVIASDLFCRTSNLTTVINNLNKDKIYPQYGSIHALHVHGYLKTQSDNITEIINNGLHQDGISIPLNLAELKLLNEKLSKWHGWLSRWQVILRNWDIEISPPWLKIKAKLPEA